MAILSIYVHLEQNKNMQNVKGLNTFWTVFCTDLHNG